MLDPAVCRSHFPSLALEHNGHPVVFFDNPAGTQVPRQTIEGFTHYLTTSNANTGGAFQTSEATGELIAATRRGMADFLGASSPDEIVIGPNMTTLTLAVARALADTLQPGDEIVTTRLEHDANVAPWLALQQRGVIVKWIDIRLEDGTLDFDSAAEVIGPRTRLVAVGYASNALGTINDVARLARMAHAVNALTFVDAVHYGPHGSIDVQALGVDLLACSSYKFFGPHLGILWGRRQVLEMLPAYRVRPAGNEPPGKWETGTGAYEAWSGLLGTLTYLRGLADPAITTPREQYVDALRRIRHYERSLTDHLLAGMSSLPGCRIYGITDPADFHHRVPTVSFTLDGHPPASVAVALGDAGIFSWAGHHYALEPLKRLGLELTNRIGLVHYNTFEEVDRFIEQIAAFSASSAVASVR